MKDGLAGEAPGVPEAAPQDGLQVSSIGDFREHTAGPPILYLPIDLFLPSILAWDGLRNQDRLSLRRLGVKTESRAGLTGR